MKTISINEASLTQLDYLLVKHKLEGMKIPKPLTNEQLMDMQYPVQLYETTMHVIGSEYSWVAQGAVALKFEIDAAKLQIVDEVFGNIAVRGFSFYATKEEAEQVAAYLQLQHRLKHPRADAPDWVTEMQAFNGPLDIRTVSEQVDGKWQIVGWTCQSYIPPGLTIGSSFTIANGDSPIQATVRCICKVRYGESVEVPENLT